jgi:hypothetical protein
MPVREVHHNCPSVQYLRCEHPQVLCHWGRANNETEIEGEILEEKCQTPPPNIWPILNEQELPTHLEVSVMELPGCNYDDVDEHTSETDYVEQNRENANDQHTLPLIALIANYAQVLGQGVLSVGVVGTLEQLQGHGGDGPKERVDEGAKNIEESVGVHLKWLHATSRHHL